MAYNGKDRSVKNEGTNTTQIVLKLADGFRNFGNSLSQLYRQFQPEMESYFERF